MGIATPFLLGAAYGAWFNRKTTNDLADTLRLDLRRKRPLTGGLGGKMARRALMPALAPVVQAEARFRRLSSLALRETAM